ARRRSATAASSGLGDSAPPPRRHRVSSPPSALPPLWCDHLRTSPGRPGRSTPEGRLRLADGRLSAKQGQSRPLTDRPVLYPAVRGQGLRRGGGGGRAVKAGGGRIAGGSPAAPC